MLPGTTATLGADGLLVVDAHSGRLVGTGATSLAAVRAAGTGHLGADGRGHAGTRFRQGTHGAAWALDVARLGVVHGRALLGLGNVLAVGCHVNDTALGVQELRGGFGCCWATAGHWYCF